MLYQTREPADPYWSEESETGEVDFTISQTADGTLRLRFTRHHGTGGEQMIIAPHGANSATIEVR